MCDDDTMKDDDPLKVIFTRLVETFAKFGWAFDMAPKVGACLRDAGFENIQCTIKKVPIGVWAQDKTLRLIGLYQKMLILDLLPAFARPFESVGMTPEESESILESARRAVRAHGVHRYYKYYFWYPKSRPPLWGRLYKDMIAQLSNDARTFRAFGNYGIVN